MVVVYILQIDHIAGNDGYFGGAGSGDRSGQVFIQFDLHRSAMNGHFGGAAGADENVTIGQIQSGAAQADGSIVGAQAGDRDQHSQSGCGQVRYVDIQPRRLNNASVGHSTKVLVGKASRFYQSLIDQCAILECAVDGVPDAVIVPIVNDVGHAGWLMPGLNQHLMRRQGRLFWGPRQGRDGTRDLAHHGFNGNAAVLGQYQIVPIRRTEDPSAFGAAALREWLRVNRRAVFVFLIHVVGEDEGVDSGLHLEVPGPHESLPVVGVDMGRRHQVVALFVFGVTEVSAEWDFRPVVQHGASEYLYGHLIMIRIVVIVVLDRHRQERPVDAEQASLNVI